jgi:hypothetical protein
MGRYGGSSPSLSSPMSGRIILMAFNDVFFFLLGGSAWILINGIYAQIPFIIPFFDGDYGVVSKITFCVTFSSLLPILLSISFIGSLLRAPAVASSKARADTTIKSSKRTRGSSTSLIPSDNQNWHIDIGIALVLSIGFVTSLVLTIWTERVTSQLVPLMATVIAGGIVGTTSSILYYPHAATTATTDAQESKSGATATSIAKRQTAAMLFGTATSNLFVAILAILQQEKIKQRPELRQETNIVRIYFGVILILMGLGLIGFVGTLVIRRINRTASDFNKSNTDSHPFSSEQSSLIETNALKGDSSSISIQHTPQSYSPQNTSYKSLSFWEITYLNSTLNASQFTLNALTFFLPGVVPYSVLNEDDEKNNSTDSLRYLIVFQLVAQTLGVLVSSSGGSSSGQSWLYNGKNVTVQRQLGCFFLFLWIPMVLLSLNNEIKFGIGIPISLNTLLNFSYGYCNTSWFHLLVNHHQEHYQHHHHWNEGKGDAVDSIAMTNKMTYPKNIGSVSTASAVRIMGTWHQIGATIGSAIAFGLVQSAAIVKTR